MLLGGLFPMTPALFCPRASQANTPFFQPKPPLENLAGFVTPNHLPAGLFVLLDSGKEDVDSISQR